MGRNKHLQIIIHLKHILKRHEHDFCGEQSIYTSRAILANQKICMHDFFCGGAPGGHREFVGGGGGARAPPS